MGMAVGGTDGIPSVRRGACNELNRWPSTYEFPFGRRLPIRLFVIENNRKTTIIRVRVSDERPRNSRASRSLVPFPSDTQCIVVGVVAITNVPEETLGGGPWTYYFRFFRTESRRRPRAEKTSRVSVRDAVVPTSTTISYRTWDFEKRSRFYYYARFVRFTTSSYTDGIERF